MCGCKCHSWKKIVLGLLILCNIYIWPLWTRDITAWMAFFGVLLVLFGIVHLVWPCNCCPVPEMKKKK